MAAFRSCLLFFSIAVATGSAGAQAPEPLTLEKVLTQGAALGLQPPSVLWRPGGHEATVIMAADDGSESLHAMQDGKVAPEPLATAAALRDLLGGKSQGPARFPPLAWLDADTLR
ncbi:MAG: hypothetical protein KDC48_22300, partial [Planctomycetes bacterium]|nr:hypothetical protein [Planctomycetota bacterium]